jgi:hypothetical protein
MYFHAQLMKARHEDHLRWAAQERLALQAKRAKQAARAARLDSDAAQRPARRRLRVLWRRVSA